MAVDPAAREVEQEIDAAFEQQPLVQRNFADALFYTLLATELILERHLRSSDYRSQFNIARAELIRDRILQLVDSVDALVRQLLPVYADAEVNKSISEPEWDEVKAAIKEIDTLLGSSVSRPGRWSDLQRHLHFWPSG